MLHSTPTISKLVQIHSTTFFWKVRNNSTSTICYSENLRVCFSTCCKMALTRHQKNRCYGTPKMRFRTSVWFRSCANFKIYLLKGISMNLIFFLCLIISISFMPHASFTLLTFFVLVFPPRDCRAFALAQLYATIIKIWEILVSWVQILHLFSLWTNKNYYHNFLSEKALFRRIFYLKKCFFHKFFQFLNHR